MYLYSLEGGRVSKNILGVTLYEADKTCAATLLIKKVHFKLSKG